MNRRACIGMLCGGCVVPTLSEDTNTPEIVPCTHDVLLEAPLLEMEIGSSLYWEKPEELLRLLIIRTKEREWKAVWRICTHGNCDVEWSAQQHLVVCPCHDSTFSVDGFVLEGPATRDLSYFPICFDEDAQQFFVQTS